jgi:hypothetical protein
MVRRIVDPSVTETLTLARDPTEFVQQLAHHWLPLFDNLGTLPDWTSDALCRAVTGDGISKRELFTDDGDFIFRFRRCGGLNGINIAAQKPDLLDRSILFGLAPISEADRKPERVFWDRFNAALPRLVGAALDVLSGAMRRLPAVSLARLPRMADFAVFGYAIAEQLGHRGQDFLSAFDKNFRVRNSEVLASSPAAEMLALLMKSRTSWEGSAATLLGELQELAQAQRIDTRGRMWPKAPHALTRRLNEVAQNLRAEGIQVTTGGTNREIAIRKCPGNGVGSVDAEEPVSDGTNQSIGPRPAIPAGAPVTSEEASPGEAMSGPAADAIDASDGIPGITEAPHATSDDAGVRPCRFPGHTRSWRSVHGTVRCGRCNPPASPELVAEWLE